ncbi:MAG: hypothetical protein HY747_05325 [Elusimicrobia bacterium]|nr:hypothetical protein [Elusimicrobiota bacterium]
MMEKMPAVKMDPKGLWREETFTDHKAGTIRRLIPVTADGSPDITRKVIFVGEAALLTSVGSLPLNFEIPAADLAQAVAGYGDAMQKAFAEAMKEIQEMRRRAASQIVIPKGAGPDLTSAKFPPDSGKFRLS